ncbi:hypothetical protein [Pseudomonas capsici]|uniref:hypothetical protein n=1 Tax=Pseudomonas capsici TaxID=2810614 RepID=UPI0013C2BE27|nr:hypothetical protein [Pseudomonas capsici]MCV4281909.1 hypothetical protein [Pseudomonas capsici]
MTPPSRKRPVFEDNFFRGIGSAGLPEIIGGKASGTLLQRSQGQNNIAREKLFLCHELYCQETSIRGGLPSKSREKTYAIKGFGYLEKIDTPSGQIRKTQKRQINGFSVNKQIEKIFF